MLLRHLVQVAIGNDRERGENALSSAVPGEDKHGQLLAHRAPVTVKRRAAEASSAEANPPMCPG
jgi:hypothetical protein